MLLCYFCLSFSNFGNRVEQERTLVNPVTKLQLCIVSLISSNTHFHAIHNVPYIYTHQAFTPFMYVFLQPNALCESPLFVLLQMYCEALSALHNITGKVAFNTEKPLLHNNNKHKSNSHSVVSLHLAK